ncbi:MAG: putative quinol monooxygenase [Parabacteroides sp.]
MNRSVKKMSIGMVLVGCFLHPAGAQAPEKADNIEKNKVPVLVNYKRKVKPECVGICKAAFERCREASIQEPGCIRYELYQSYADSTIFFMLEQWQDEEAFQLHMQKPYLRRYMEEVRGIDDPSGERLLHHVFISPALNENYNNQKSVNP